jgi:hypothetical protein
MFMAERDHVHRKRYFLVGLSLRWPNGKGISQPKMKDLKSMLSLIPSDAKPFYRNFFKDPRVCDDIEGFNADLDFEIDFDYAKPIANMLTCYVDFSNP